MESGVICRQRDPSVEQVGGVSHLQCGAGSLGGSITALTRIDRVEAVAPALLLQR